MFKIDLETDNAAFIEAGPGAEVARILRQIARCAEEGQTEGIARDFNGNKVGSWSLEVSTNDE